MRMFASFPYMVPWTAFELSKVKRKLSRAMAAAAEEMFTVSDPYCTFAS